MDLIALKMKIFHLKLSKAIQTFPSREKHAHFRTPNTQIMFFPRISCIKKIKFYLLLEKGDHKAFGKSFNVIDFRI